MKFTPFFNFSSSEYFLWSYINISIWIIGSISILIAYIIEKKRKIERGKYMCIPCLILTVALICTLIWEMNIDNKKMKDSINKWATKKAGNNVKYSEFDGYKLQKLIYPDGRTAIYDPWTDTLYIEKKDN
ncbi:hypothetical protein AUK11_03000 [bacterium CG2_30_37_16]|nr:MAG: hypothetical protein AUK11_03000 [bacterium CG2_30_37_16]PIP30900.1 MAG: hypothetical protein COX25_02340 [bacterium (Candidatus Howlettbacteria) CG23_combo_of_CG06-09_8_20_14_all_37_9]PIX99685.1 MAG: hypothetical protein COZ22_01965 [bacterium (Candidatus Howlettbacteria) CG_4_10_14_3_um_filter_37_10]PJB06618.1 MAG: hypothetical protein CO123_01745 [bacterium (Candidatus Howlettbacteria) CG_4_9_14_3_um_filter_37_10]